jgi:hypothetical protein
MQYSCMQILLVARVRIFCVGSSLRGKRALEASTMIDDRVCVAMRTGQAYPALFIITKARAEPCVFMLLFL